MSGRTAVTLYVTLKIEIFYIDIRSVGFQKFFHQPIDLAEIRRSVKEFLQSDTSKCPRIKLSLLGDVTLCHAPNYKGIALMKFIREFPLENL